MRDDFLTDKSPSLMSGGRDILPTNVKPLHYDLTLEPSLASGVLQYEGKVVIDLDVLEDTDCITLNSIDLNIYHAAIQNSAGITWSDLQLLYDKTRLQVTVNLGYHTLPAGSNAKLLLLFTGKLQDDAVTGLFRSSYHDENGARQHVISSQFQPVSARSAFPCFDEPALKSTFAVTLIVNKGLTCLSNMPVKHVKPHDSSREAVSFQPTPLMPTYLLAFAIGKFSKISTNTFRVPVSLYATPNNDVETGRFALELTAKTLAFYEEKFGSPFPLPKADLVAIPGYRGAMEHWGIVTSTEDGLLYDESKGSVLQKQKVAQYMHHELAHQWFGNLVTMEFWDGLWLNEGFATWTTMYANDSFFPEWKVREKFLVTDYRAALDLDSLRSSHPIEVPVKSAADIGQIFDAISYSKGASVLRMLAGYIGEDVFLKGVQVYLKRHEYGNTTTAQLWEALSQVSKVDVHRIMDTWTTKAGHPMVEVIEDSDHVRLKQCKLLRTGDLQPEDNKVIFPIPITIRTTDGEEHRIVLRDRECKMKMNKSALVKINVNHIGFFRTLYSSERLETLASVKRTLSATDRAGIIADAATLASAGYQSSYDLLSLLQGFSKESELVVWRTIVFTLEALRAALLFEDNKTQDALQAFVRRLVSPKAHSIGWTFLPSDDANQISLKKTLFVAAGSAGDEEVVQAAFAMFNEYKAGNDSAIDPNLLAAVFFVVCSSPSSGDQEYDFVRTQSQNAKIIEERIVASVALGRFRRPELIRRTLDWILRDSDDDGNVAFSLSNVSLLNEVVTSREGIVEAWEWLRGNFDRITSKAKNAMSMIASSCTGHFTRRSQIEAVRKFWNGRKTEGFERGIEQGLDEARVKAKWIESGKEDAERWLRERGFLEVD